MAINIKNLPKNTILVSYDSLSPDAKSLARKDIIDSEVIALNNNIFIHKSKNIQTKVNSLFSYKSLLNGKMLISKLRSDIKYCEKFITDNICQFTNNGTYVKFSS